MRLVTALRAWWFCAGHCWSRPSICWTRASTPSGLPTASRWPPSVPSGKIRPDTVFSMIGLLKYRVWNWMGRKQNAAVCATYDRHTHCFGSVFNWIRLRIRPKISIWNLAIFKKRYLKIIYNYFIIIPFIIKRSRLKDIISVVDPSNYIELGFGSGSRILVNLSILKKKIQKNFREK